MKIYLASSWRNTNQPNVVKRLRERGHNVYDFENPTPTESGFHWSRIDPNWQKWNLKQYKDALGHNVSNTGFGLDWGAMKWAEAGVLLLPCGRSAHIEAGYFVGANKPLYILLAEGGEPELMYKMADETGGGVFVDIDSMLDFMPQPHPNGPYFKEAAK
jgi:hypothetical protein